MRRPLQTYSKTYKVTRKPSASSWRYAHTRELEMPTQYILPHRQGHQLCYRLVTICKHLPICESNSTLSPQRYTKAAPERNWKCTKPGQFLHTHCISVIVYLHETRKIQRMKARRNTIIGVSDSLQSTLLAPSASKDL